MVRMDYLRGVDHAAFAAASPDQRLSQSLLDHTSGGQTCSINYIRTPAGGGSPAGMHTHAVDQIFYILSGTMNLEIEGTQYEAGPGTLVVFPAGVPHRNWNGGGEPTIHLAFNAPMPDPNVPFARPVPTLQTSSSSAARP
jgi:mannose-6-phosphate isomerase-like protein (cupin superfamily)